MLDSLKDMYISYPFMPLTSAPELFRNVKDIRCFIELPATKAISKYKNGNYVRAWLTGINNSTATVEFICEQVDLAPAERVLTIPVCNVADGVPTAKSYVLVDSVIAASDIKYELQPDTLLFVQKAPRLFINETPVSNSIIHTEDGYNVSINKAKSGVTIYGAVGAGSGSYNINPMSADKGPRPEALPAWRVGYGAKTLNGMFGEVSVQGSAKVKVVLSAPARNDTEAPMLPTNYSRVLTVTLEGV